MTSATPVRASSSRFAAAYGTAGTTTPLSATAARLCISTRGSCITSGMREDSFRCGARHYAPRPPQGYPVLANAGVSDTGKEFAADIAEIVFTPLNTLAEAQTLYRDLKRRMEKYGRRAEHLKIMPGLNAIVGRTDEEARETHEFLQSLIHPDVGRQLLSTELGVDLSSLPVDGPLPYHLIDAASTAQRKILVDQAK